MAGGLNGDVVDCGVTDVVVSLGGTGLVALLGVNLVMEGLVPVLVLLVVEIFLVLGALVGLVFVWNKFVVDGAFVVKDNFVVKDDLVAKDNFVVKVLVLKKMFVLFVGSFCMGMILGGAEPETECVKGDVDEATDFE